MNRFVTFIYCTLTIILVSACSGPEEINYQTLNWEDLEPFDQQPIVPESPLKALGIVDNLNSDRFTQELGLDDDFSLPMQQPYAVGVVDEFDGKQVRVPGFVVPVEFDSENRVTEFFLVPYFGACFHKPPPPANQTIYVTTATPIEYESIYDAVWVMGTLKTEMINSDIAAAAYQMDLHDLEPYWEE